VHAQDAPHLDAKNPSPQFFLNLLIFFLTAPAWTGSECYTRFGYVHAQDALLFDAESPSHTIFAKLIDFFFHRLDVDSA
jgi:hypothetical protein